MMKNRGWEAEVIFEEIERVDPERLAAADLVGISTITSTAPRAYEIADAARMMGVPVILGGPHVSFMPDEALDHADFVLRGEGERALMKFIDAWEGGRDFSNVPNLSYTVNGRPLHNDMQPHCLDLDSLPWPDFSLMRGGIKRIAGQRIIPIQTSRGCPFDCSFCSVTGMFGRNYRFRSTEHVIGELRMYDAPGNFVFFYDDNFTANRRRAKELLRAMIGEGFRFKWSTQVRVDVARDAELMDLMKEAGCHTVFIGFESVNPVSLREMKKKQDLEDIIAAINALKKRRIHIHGMFVHGFDGDDWSSVEATVAFAKKVQLTSYQFMILTPLPGSEFYRRTADEGRLLTGDWSLYDTHHVVFRPKRFTPPELQWAQLYSHRKLYSAFQIMKKLLKGNLVGAGLSIYAHRLNGSWQRKNRDYLRMIGVIRSSIREMMKVNYRKRLARAEEASAS
jgi:radical SAM superfamily enzyme YgiQ (UPF0313 family)